jgi:tripartite-type tricarboxylate transporter receptor subunit TctC
MARKFRTGVGVSAALVFAASTALMALPTASAAVPKYPTRPIEIIVPYAAGGGVDQTARALAPILQQELKVPVIVSDIPGAGSITGTSVASDSVADGYTLFFDSPGIIDAPWIEKGVPFGPQSFKYVGQITYIPNYLDVPVTSPFKTLKQLVAYARKHPNKLKAPFTAGWPSTDVMGAEFAYDAHLKFTTVSGFTGGPAELLSALAGRTSFSYNNTGEVLSDVRAGKVRILATSAPKRSPIFPKVPTFEQQGYPVAVGVWQGLAAPAKTPQYVMNVLDKALAEAAKSPELKANFAKIGITVDYLNSVQTTKLIYSEYKSDGQLFKRLGVAK